MNALLNRFLFVALMIFGAVNLGNTANFSAIEDGGEMGIIAKTGNSGLSITFSKEFLKSDNQLATTAIVTISVGNEVLFATQTGSSHLEITGLSLEKGTTYFVTAIVGEKHFTEKLTW